MELQEFLPFLLPTHGRIYEVIYEILSLESKLRKVENESEYFRWGMENHSRRLARLLMVYDDIRREFNNSSLDELIEGVNENEAAATRHMKLSPSFIRAVALQITFNKFMQKNEFIMLKSFTDELPDIDFLRHDLEILRDVDPRKK